MAKSITRRNLVTGTALAGAAAAVNAMPVFAAEGEAFDDEYDVVVVGMGGAGMNAAVAAYVGDARQFDDLTMMCLHYSGPDVEK